MTVGQIIADAELKLYQGDITDDATLEHSQIKLWINEYLNPLVANEINTKKARGESIPAVYVKRQSCIVGEAEETDCADDCEERIFVELEEEVLTLNDDWGIIRVETSEGDTVRKASVETLNLFKHLRFSKPSEDNLIYSHQGEKIFVEGIKDSDLAFDKLNVWYVPKQDFSDATNDTEVLVSDLVLPQLIDLIVAQGKSMLYGTQPDTDNDGVAYQTPVYHQQIKSPEQPIE